MICLTPLKENLATRMFKPLNRHLLVEKVELEAEKEKEDSLVLVPDDYKLIKKSAHGLYKVIAEAEDCEKVSNCEGREIVVDESMVQKIALNNKTYYLILENYIYGVYTK